MVQVAMAVAEEYRGDDSASAKETAMADLGARLVVEGRIRGCPRVGHHVRLAYPLPRDRDLRPPTGRAWDCCCTVGVGDDRPPQRGCRWLAALIAVRPCWQHQLTVYHGIHSLVISPKVYQDRLYLAVGRRPCPTRRVAGRRLDPGGSARLAAAQVQGSRDK